MIEEIEELKESGMLFTEFDFHDMHVPDEAIKAMCLNISHDCNMRCRYCSRRREASNPRAS
jgi:uncharacterized protein